MSHRLTSICFIVSLTYTLVAALASVVHVENGGPGTVLKLGKLSYYITPKPYSTVKPTTPPHVRAGFSAVTSIRATFSPIGKAFLESQFTLFQSIDDVWNDKFLESMYISYDGPATGYFEPEAERWLETLKISHLFLSNNTRIPTLKGLRVLQIETGPPSGPYFTTSSPTEYGIDIYDVYRLHKDEYESFLFGVIPNPEGGWIQTNITLGESSQYLPIPSRLALVASGLPLSGMRFALKDIYDVKGLPTGAGSVAYEEINDLPDSTAPSVARLLSLGATMIGKTRTSQFAHGAQPWEYVDVPYSWNPRGDGFLTASASSSGSACAIAGYEWLDFAVGSDTRGSIRKPAALVGAYGFRPTHGSMDLLDVMPLSEEMDTAGFFARDPRLLAEIGRLWFQESPVRNKRSTIRFPPKLIYPTEHFPVQNPAAQLLYDSFADSLKKHLRITKAPTNFTEVLTPYFPNGNFTEFQLASNVLAEYRSWWSVGRPLVNRYQRVYGSYPDLDPRPRQMFARGQRLSKKNFDDAVAVRRQFSKSISEDLIKADRKSCSDSLFMYDAGSGGHPSYRVEDFNALDGATQFRLTGVEQDAKASDFFTYVGSMAGLPEVTVPIGQVSYFSQVTREWEMLPVTVQLAAHPGCDDMLFDLVKKLSEIGVISSTKVGKEAF